MLKFLNDDDLSDSEKNDIYQILNPSSSQEDSIKCFFLDDVNSVAALKKYEKTQGVLSPASFQNQAQYFVNAAKLGHDQWSHPMYYIAAQQSAAAAGTPHPYNPAYFCLPAHGLQPGAAAFLQQTPTTLMSPPAGPCQWPQLFRFVTPSAGAPNQMPIYYPLLYPAAVSSSQQISASDLSGSGSHVSPIAAENARLSSHMSSIQGMGNLELPKVRNERITPAFGHEAAVSRSNLSSLNSSTDAVQNIGPCADQQPNLKICNGGGTDVVPLDPEPNEHLTLNSSGILLAPELALLREENGNISSNGVPPTSTPIDGEPELTDAQTQDDDFQSNDNLPAMASENSSPNKAEENAETEVVAAEDTVQAENKRNEEDAIKAQYETNDIDKTPHVEKLVQENPSVTQAQPATTSVAPVAAVASAKKTWASLFQNSATATNAIVISKLGEDDNQLASAIAASQQTLAEENTAHTSQPLNPPSGLRLGSTIDKSQFTVTVTTVDRDPPAQKLMKCLVACKLEHKGPSYQTRGLKNSGNWCYVNAVLQALLACPPFVHLLRNLSFLEMRTPSSTPMLDALVKFVSEFVGDKHGGRKTGDDRLGPFEPTFVYNVLSCLRSDLGSRGRQEDAEEFLSFMLNQLHEEMAACLNANNPAVDHGNAQNQESRFGSDSSNTSANDSSEWQQVMPGRRLATARTTKLSPTPIAAIFSGVVRNVFTQTGQKDSVNNESFFTLQLSVAGDSVSSSNPLALSSAMQQMAHEIILRKDSGKKSEIEIARRTTFHELPLVLILHLKYFTFANDAVRKHIKQVTYHMDLQIEKPLMPNLPSQRNARSYKLFAVVFHHGDNAEGGHYTADVFHGGQWLNMDDGKYEVVPDSHVLDFLPPRVPYLLFYRRCDVFSDNRSGAYSAGNANAPSGQTQYNNFQKNRFAAAGTQDNN